MRHGKQRLNYIAPSITNHWPDLVLFAQDKLREPLYYARQANTYIFTSPDKHVRFTICFNSPPELPTQDVALTPNYSPEPIIVLRLKDTVITEVEFALKILSEFYCSGIDDVFPTSSFSAGSVMN